MEMCNWRAPWLALALSASLLSNSLVILTQKTSAEMWSPSQQLRLWGSAHTNASWTSYPHPLLQESSHLEAGIIYFCWVGPVESEGFPHVPLPSQEKLPEQPHLSSVARERGLSPCLAGNMILHSESEKHTAGKVTGSQINSRKNCQSAKLWALSLHSREGQDVEGTQRQACHTHYNARQLLR